MIIQSVRAACSTISRVIDTESVGCHPRSTTKEMEESGEKDKEEKAASLEKPRSGVQDVSQEEIGEKRAVTDRKREGSRWRRNAAGTEGGKRTTKPGRKKGGGAKVPSSRYGARTHD